MSLQESARAAPAATARDPQVDRLVRAITTASSTSVEAAATAAHPSGGGGWGGEAARVGDMTPRITLMKKCGPNPLMSKKIFLDEKGALRIDGSQCVMKRSEKLECEKTAAA